MERFKFSFLRSCRRLEHRTFKGDTDYVITYVNSYLFTYVQLYVSLNINCHNFSINKPEHAKSFDDDSGV